jgi:hypothetical protein
MQVTYFVHHFDKLAWHCDRHAAMDAAVLAACGWSDVAQTARCEFLLGHDHEEDDQPDAFVAWPRQALALLLAQRIP